MLGLQRFWAFNKGYDCLDGIFEKGVDGGSGTSEVLEGEDELLVSSFQRQVPSSEFGIFDK